LIFRQGKRRADGTEDVRRQQGGVGQARGAEPGVP